MTQETQEIQKTVAAVLDEAPAAPQDPPVPAAAPQDPPAPPAGGPPAPGAPKTAAKKRKAKKRVKRIIALVVTLALLAGIGWAVWYFLLRKTVEQGQLLEDEVRIGTIQSKVEGSGNARAGENAVITLSASGTVQEVYVAVGDLISAGDPLYSIYSPAAQKAVQDAEDAVEQAKEAIPAAQEAVAEAREGILTAQEGVQEAQDAVTEAKEALAERQKELAKLQESLAELSVTAPFAGKLISVEDITVGSRLSEGAAIATLANNKVMRLALYFSYGYENDIYVGQKAEVSVPGLMLTCPGTVSAVNRISLVSPEGGILFEAVIDVANPGALTEDLAASAVLTSAGGEEIFPYDEGKLAYSEVVKLEAKQSGPVTSKALLKYADVAQGQVLLVQGSDDLDEQIAAKQKEIKSAEKGVTQAMKGVTSAEKGVTAAQKAVDQAIKDVEKAERAVPEAEEALEKARQDLEDLNAAAPIGGTVTSCTISPGQEVKGGDTVITISDTTNMVVEIKVNDQNIGYITPGMMVELSNYGEGMWMGVVTKIDMNPSQDDMGSGVTNYPVTLTVDNYDGTLITGMWLQYSFVASQVDDCLIVPNQAVKSTVDEEGNDITVVFLKADFRPDNAITMPEQPPDRPKTYPTEDEGYYAVPVVIGASDTYNVEIRSGLNEFDIVFTNYLSASGNSWGMYG